MRISEIMISSDFGGQKALPSILCVVLLMLITTTVNAEVSKSADDGFILQHSVTVSHDKATVFKTMTSEVGKWWNSEHSFSADANNMHIDENCFCERWADNLVRHLDTVMWLENSKVIMEGGLGPLKELGLNGTMVWSLASSDSVTTHINWKYHVYGFSDTSLTELAVAVDGVLKEQIDRLVNYLD